MASRKRFRRLIIPFTLALAAISTDAAAQLFRSTSKVGTTAGQFLKIGHGARAIGMGGAQVGTSRDFSAIYWNPAGLSRLEVNGELGFHHVNWLADISYDAATGILPVRNLGTFGFFIVSMRVPEDVVRTVEFPEGDGRVWDATSFALGVAYAANLTDRFSIGFVGKYVREAIWTEKANGFAFDFGTLYRSEIRGLSLGASISNFGTKMRLEGRSLYFNYDPDNNPGTGPGNIPAQLRTTEFDLPLSFRIGIGYDIFPMEEVRVTTAIDATHPNDNTEYINSGLEFAWREIIFARVGYTSLFMRDSEQGLTWGFGVQYGLPNVVQFRLDYGFADYGRLNNVQFFTLALTF